MTLTSGQITTFITIASCCLACYASDTVKLQQMGDLEYCSHKQKVLLAQQYIGMVERYISGGENNCLTADELFKAMEKTNQILSICTDIYSLPETN